MIVNYIDRSTENCCSPHWVAAEEETIAGMLEQANECLGLYRELYYC